MDSLSPPPMGVLFLPGTYHTHTGCFVRDGISLEGGFFPWVREQSPCTGMSRAHRLVFFFSSWRVVRVQAKEPLGAELTTLIRGVCQGWNFPRACLLRERFPCPVLTTSCLRFVRDGISLGSGCLLAGAPSQPVLTTSCLRFVREGTSLGSGCLLAGAPSQPVLTRSYGTLPAVSLRSCGAHYHWAPDSPYYTCGSQAHTVQLES